MHTRFSVFSNHRSVVCLWGLDMSLSTTQTQHGFRNTEETPLPVCVCVCVRIRIVACSASLLLSVSTGASAWLWLFPATLLSLGTFLRACYSSLSCSCRKFHNPAENISLTNIIWFVLWLLTLYVEKISKRKWTWCHVDGCSVEKCKENKGNMWKSSKEHQPITHGSV